MFTTDASATHCPKCQAQRTDAWKIGTGYFSGDLQGRPRGRRVAWLVAAILGMSSSTSCFAGPASEEPFLKRRLAFTGWSACEEVLDADVFVELVPVNSVPSADQSPALTFYGCGMNEARKPSQWHGQAPSIAQLDGERVFRHRHRFGDRQ